jgi:hypothetical protein
LAVTIGFGPTFLLADPSLTEMQIVNRFAVFVLNEWDQQLFMDAQMPGDIDAARDLAIEIAKVRRVPVNQAVASIKSGVQSVGDPADFVGYEPAKFVVPEVEHKSSLGEFGVWRGDVRDTFVVDFFKDRQVPEAAAADAEATTEGSNWFLGSLSV